MIKTVSLEKAKNEAKRAKQYRNLWISQNKPKKCLKCLSLINFCRFWNLNYRCENEQAKEIYNKNVSEINRFLQSTKRLR